MLGKMDDVRVYNHALSLKEVKELSQAKILHYKFDDFQEPTENFIPNGHFANGEGVPSESGSNPTNDIVQFPNPGDTEWCLRQTGSNTEYEVHFKDGTQIQPSTTYTMSCWVAYTPDWNGNDQIFHARWYSTDGTNATYNGKGSLLKTTEFGGLLWEHRSLTFTTNAGADGRFNWYLGYAAQNTQGYRYITNIQIEPRSYATPFVDGVREGLINDSSGYDTDAQLDLSSTPQWTKETKLGEGCYYFNGEDSFISTSFSTIGSYPFTLAA